MGAIRLLHERLRHSSNAKLAWSITGVMSTLLVYGFMQEKIMRSPYGEEKEFFKYSLFIVFCNRLLTCSVCTLIILVRQEDMRPVAPLYKYAGVSLSNVLATSCQYEALKFVSFPVQTLAKCAKMIPVMVTPGLVPYNNIVQSTTWGVVLMIGYLGFDGFTSTFQDKLFKGYNMDIYNQILYVTLCSCGLSLTGLLMQGQGMLALYFVLRHPDCLFDIMLLSLAATTSQFFISYTIRTFGALIFATIMTTRQVLVFGSLYYRSYLNSKKHTNGNDASILQLSKGIDKAELVALLNGAKDSAENSRERVTVKVES
ncbi:hypothetical protein CY35_07G017200 [Sphagnum magellanicum]|uniref:Uncharacterized protein n=2 Tax=Sphagnum magellanicum TaxID=128215 RepID=A0ACB8HJK6_9BRYO|nr:hypothetical protein CY35_07G017200 [Sphagnum magellanicum]